MSREVLTTIMIVGGILLAFIIVKKVASGVLKLVLIGFIVVSLFGGSSLIKLNTLPQSVLDKLSDVKEAVGEYYDTYVKTDGDTVFVKIGDEWYDTGKLLIGNSADGKNVSIKYDGKDISVGEPLPVSIVKTLKDVGIINGD